jgi:NAD(P)-dependent dehydrogenase (short-subunit alcohol dehydrogenase family)
MSNQRVVLITGASSGVGQSTARLLSQRGYKVFGTSRTPASADSFPGVEMLSLDVRTEDSVRACVQAVSNRGGHLDVLINNAGYELAGALEELSMEEARAQFETNFFGVVRMRYCHSCVARRVDTSSMLARSLACRRSHSWASILPASLLWKATRKPFGTNSRLLTFMCP